MMKKLGWIGTGVMGKSMCRHLIKAGHKLMIFSRTKAKTDELVSEGAEYAEPLTIAKACDIVFLMVGYPKDVEELVLGTDGVLNAMRENSYLVDHTTSSPTLAKKIFEVDSRKL
eukprot:TRINITY_DN1527_c0_g1_i1.p2 TRINITY_DN1527_c0_g1~~TRINITY_DN1527_c0_g1_i1.p2  ORF type:complete len:131 (-),score=40.77 TRINITY_DN1527_c0_g1_i1:657-998(-)